MAQMLGFDEYGRPFLIMNDQENQQRLTGLDALKVIMMLQNALFNDWVEP